MSFFFGNKSNASNTLPVELKLLILSFLPPQDLVAIAQTSKDNNALIRDDLLWASRAKSLLPGSENSEAGEAHNSEVQEETKYDQCRTSVMNNRKKEFDKLILEEEKIKEFFTNAKSIKDLFVPVDYKYDSQLKELHKKPSTFRNLEANIELIKKFLRGEITAEIYNKKLELQDSGVIACNLKFLCIKKALATLKRMLILTPRLLEKLSVEQGTEILFYAFAILLPTLVSCQISTPLKDIKNQKIWQLTELLLSNKLPFDVEQLRKSESVRGFLDADTEVRNLLEPYVIEPSFRCVLF